MPLATGIRLGPYEILGPLGAGGMGEVYKARDTRLDRTVAIKVLPEDIASDPELRQRLEREARAISSLDHPHICALYDVGHQNGIDFLVMQYLEGETLADRLGRGALSVDLTLTYGIEIADALDRAHRQGIVHRDLKPSNIMLTKSGVKVLAFGLAKLKEADGRGDLAGLTRSTPLTEQGTVLGTLHYMSPEQLEGKEADARTDIFAFGAVLYELLTGERAFAGKSQATIIASILGADPVPLTTRQPQTPFLLDRLVQRCLAKDPEQRWQSMRDVVLELTWIREGPLQPELPSRAVPRRTVRRILGVLSALGLLGLFVTVTIALLNLGKTPAPASAPLIRFTIAMPENTSLNPVYSGATLSVSPDGLQLAFISQGADAPRLWLRRLDTLTARMLAGTEGAAYPFWSPDSRAIGFFANGKLKTIELSDGQIQVLADAPNARLTVHAFGPIPLQCAASHVTDMPLSAGTHLGPYQIVALLGAGGMGEVYRAHDPRLGRDVAIKVLPAGFSVDSDRLRRFEQEARAAAALNHPNILAVYDLGTHDGAPYVVSELLAGTTLREALANGALPVRKAIDYATQIANGLATAHEKGIVHRDLKPENLFITSDGRAKILDFGIAKLMETGPATAGATMPATRTAGTTPGIVLGTIGYMSPEQVRGQAVDHRSDIFSFGAVLYEMLSGERPFGRDTPADTMSAILNDEPRELPTVSGGVVSPTLDRITRHCLEKEPDRRFQSARDLAFDLETASGISGATATDHAPALSSRRRWQAPVAAGFAGLACGALAVWMIGRSPQRTVAASPLVEHVARITYEKGFSEWPTWSPDSNLFAFSSNRNGNFEIFVGRVRGGQVVNVTNHAADDVQPAFSPDGSTLAFISTRSSRTGLVKIGSFFGLDTRTYGGDLWVTPALGGQASRLAENANFPIWHPGSRTVLYVTGQENHRAIATISIDGGSPNPILPSAESTWEITRLGRSPDARWVTFETADRQVFVMPATGGQPRKLLRGDSHVWDAAGRYVYYANHEAAGGTRIEAAEVQESAAAPTVVRVLVVGVSTGTLRDLAIAADGKQLLASGVEESLNLTRVPLAPGGGDVAGPEEELSSGQQVHDRFPAISPDGRRITVGSNRIGDEGLWIVDVSSVRWQRVQIPADGDDWKHACWAADGRHLVVKRYFRTGTAALWYIAIDGSSAKELVPPAPRSIGDFACAFSPDGRRLVYGRLAGGFNQLFILDVASRQQQPLTRSPSDKYQAAWSPDGRWVTFSANTDGTLQVWRIPAAGGEEQPLTAGNERMMHAFYSPDGRWLYVQPSHRNIHRMPADGGPLRPVTRFPESGLFLEEPAISPDGRYLAYNRSHGGSSLWMLTIVQ